MKILHVVPTYYPAVRYGGTIPAVHELAKAQAASGCEVQIFTTDVDGPGVLNVPLAQPVSMDGVTVWYFRTGLGRRLYRSPDMGRALRTKLHAFDIVHLHSVFLWPTMCAARMARARRKPYVLTPHGMLAGDLIQRKSRLIKRAWIETFERRNLRAAAAVHVTSDLEEEELRKLGFGPLRIVKVPNGVSFPEPGGAGDGDVACPDGAGGRDYILFLGRVNWKKGLDRIIPAMAHIDESAELIVAGHNDEGYQSSLEAMAQKVGVAGRVRFIGPVQGAQKWRLIAGARLLVLPSYNENFGIVVLEAMAVGCPVVVTPEVGVAPGVKASGAGIVVNGDPVSLALGINALLGDAERRSEMGAAGVATAKREYSWDGVARKMDQFYRDCLKTTANMREKTASQGMR